MVIAGRWWGKTVCTAFSTMMRSSGCGETLSSTTTLSATSTPPAPRHRCHKLRRKQQLCLLLCLLRWASTCSTLTEAMGLSRCERVPGCSLLLSFCDIVCVSVSPSLSLPLTWLLTGHGRDPWAWCSVVWSSHKYSHNQWRCVVHSVRLGVALLVVVVCSYLVATLQVQPQCEL